MGEESIKEVVILGVNLDDILLILSRKNFEKEAEVKHEELERMEGDLRCCPFRSNSAIPSIQEWGVSKYKPYTSAIRGFFILQNIVKIL